MYSIEVSMLYTYTYAYLYLYMAYTYIHTVPKPTYLPYIHENGESLVALALQIRAATGHKNPNGATSIQK